MRKQNFMTCQMLLIRQHCEVENDERWKAQRKTMDCHGYLFAKRRKTTERESLLETKTEWSTVWTNEKPAVSPRFADLSNSLESKERAPFTK